MCIRTGTIEGRTVIAVDGKTMRGARQGQVSVPHLLAVLDQVTGTVLTQEWVADKSNQRSPPCRSCSNRWTSTGRWPAADAIPDGLGAAGRRTSCVRRSAQHRTSSPPHEARHQAGGRQSRWVGVSEPF